ncbi:hypothetical protein ILYODFUR_033095 [Ilyodon furcidens]|uniref:Secreted protein n=1 Tax=Ilyodon furcidens TaxID=33524 RepID=A0ABV0UX88_9TELE
MLLDRAIFFFYWIYATLRQAYFFCNPVHPPTYSSFTLRSLSTESTFAASSTSVSLNSVLPWRIPFTLYWRDQIPVTSLWNFCNNKLLSP